MRELHGVISTSPFDHASLKQHLLLFDKIYIVGLDRRLASPEAFPEFPVSYAADTEFLRDRGVVAEAPIATNEIPAFAEGSHAVIDESLHIVRDSSLDDSTKLKFLFVEAKLLFDRMVREVAAVNASQTGIDTVPLCTHPLPGRLDKTTALQDVTRIVVSSLPVPDFQTSFDDILNFKQEMQNKNWNLHRFIKALATQQRTEAEIRDDFEWSLNEYTKAMRLNGIKASQSFVDLFVITPLEIIEDLVKINWSKIAKGALQVRKRKVELLETEMKAPGRECAYVFDALKRFGGPSGGA
jgi:hypothetical protein